MVSCPFETLYLLASRAGHVLGVRADCILLSTLDDLFVEGDCGNGGKVCHSTLHVVAVPVGAKMGALLLGSLKCNAARYAGEHRGWIAFGERVFGSKRKRWMSVLSNDERRAL